MLRSVTRPILAVALLGFAVPLPAQEIHQAVQEGDLDRVVALLDGDPASVGAVDEQERTPIHLAAIFGHVDIARLLIERGAEVASLDHQGFSPLGMAIFRQRMEMIDLLLDAGADPVGAGGMRLSAIDLAFYQDCLRGTEMTEHLLSRGAEFDATGPWQFPVSRLHLTATFGNAIKARLVLERGVDPDLKGRGDETALIGAARGNHTELMQVLLDADADPNLADAVGNTPLSWAVERGHAEAIRTLLEHGAETDFVDPAEGRTLLHVAALGGHLPVVEVLVGNGLQVSARDAGGKTPLHYATRYGHRRVADFLLANGADRSEIETERFGASPYLAGEVEEGTAALWYLNHRGWAVKTSEHFLVFDQEEFGVTRPTDPSLANGFLAPWEIGDQDVVAMYTCYHGEIGEPAYIHEIEDSLASVVYIQNAGDRWRGSDRSVYLSPGEEAPLNGGRVSVIGTMTQMATLGHLVEIDDLVLYYQGFRPDDMEYYLGELDHLATVTDGIDVAFLPIPESVEAYDGSGLQAFVERFRPRAIAFLDPGRREELYPLVAEQVRSAGYDPDFFLARNPGDVFLLERH